jgi:hypothetical protein
MPRRLEIKGQGCVPLDTMQANAAYALSLGIPEIQSVPPHDRPLAVVGGGQSALDAMDELQDWPGDIWAVNGACSWLSKRGVPSTLFSVDADPCLADLLDGVDSAIISSGCDKAVFDALQGRVSMFHTEHIEGPGMRFIGGTTSACRCQGVALWLGYRHVSFFGCEGNFTGATHSFKDERPERQVLIEAGGQRYVTTLQFMMQSENLAELIRGFPGMFFDRSGGLLKAMIDHPDTWEVVGLTPVLKREIDMEEGEWLRVA